MEIEMDDKEIEKMREDILDGKLLKWDVKVDEGTPPVKGEGYFGNFTVITVGGKKTMVFCDPRDAICVPMLSEWYDDIAFTERGWDVDTRFQTNPNWNPLLVKKNGKWTMVGYYGNKIRRGKYDLRVPYCDEWYDSIGNREHWKCFDKDGRPTSNSIGCSSIERWYDAVKDGKPVRLTRKCQVLDENIHDLMAEVKKWDKDKILSDWIDNGRPCYSIHGYRFKGAKPVPVSNDKAREMIKIHSFGKGFNSLDWAVEDGKVVLLFAIYSECDME